MGTTESRPTSTGTAPTTRVAFPPAIRDYLKRTALLLEIEKHRKPFFPDQAKDVADAHLVLVEQITATFPQLDLFVSVVLRIDDPETRATNGVCSYTDQTGEVIIKCPTDEPVLGDAVFDVYHYLRDAASNRANETGCCVRSAITDWLGQKVGQFYIASYFVSAVGEERVENFRSGNWKARIGGRFLPILEAWTDLLRTEAFAIDSNPATALPASQPAYFTAAMLVGVQDWGPEGEPAHFAAMLEALFIQYQLAWSFPILSDQRKRQLEKQSALQKCVELDLREKLATFKVVETITGDLTALSDKIRRLQGLFDPFDSQLLARYKLPGKFISEAPPEQFFDWSFEHDWSVEWMRERSEDFQQQFACVLLACCSPAGTLPDPHPLRRRDPWPAQPHPAQMLKRDLERVPGVFKRLFAETITKVVNTDSVPEWTDEDARAFGILKAAFYNAFKHGQRKLTGPLLALWAEENGHSFTDETLKLLTNNKSARDGDGWCRVEALVSLHQLIELHRRGDTKNPANTSLNVILTPLTMENRSYGARVQIVNCHPDFVQHVENLQTPSDPAAIGGDEYFGNLNKAVAGVLKWCRPMDTDILNNASARVTILLTDRSNS